jgi:dolichol kinase
MAKNLIIRLAPEFIFKVEPSLKSGSYDTKLIHYAIIVRLDVIKLSVVMLNVTMLSVLALEMTDSSKHASLLRRDFNYRRKRFYRTDFRRKR